MKFEPVEIVLFGRRQTAITAGPRKSELWCVYQSNIIGLFLFDTNLKCQQYKGSMIAYLYSAQAAGLEFFIHSI